MSKRKVIVFDMDGVLADFTFGFSSLMHQIDPRVQPIHTWEQDDWGAIGNVADKELMHQAWERVFQSTTFWQNLLPLITPEEARRIRGLIDIYDLYFCTSRPGKETQKQSRVWLMNYMEFIPSVVVSSRKGEFCKVVQADFAIDDKTKNVNCIDWLTDGGTTPYLLTRKYNTHGYDPEVLSSGVIRVNTVSEFLGEVEG